MECNYFYKRIGNVAVYCNYILNDRVDSRRIIPNPWFRFNEETVQYIGNIQSGADGFLDLVEVDAWLNAQI